MDITLARTFLTICDLGNFVKASERLNVTQSTVSSRIKLLEDLLGQALFVRTKAGASLTAAGVQFRPFAEKLIQTWEQARHNVGLPTAFSALLTVGAEFTLWERMMVSWISWMRRDLPDVALRADVGTSEMLVGQVMEGLIDLALTYTPQHRSGLVVEEIAEDRLVLAASGGASVMPGDPGYVFVDWGAEFRAEHLEAFPDLPAPELAVSYGPLAQQHILRAGGAAYLPLRAVRPRLEDGSLHLVEKAPVFRRPVFMVFLEGIENPQFETAIQGLRRIAADEADAPDDG